MTSNRQCDDPTCTRVKTSQVETEEILPIQSFLVGDLLITSCYIISLTCDVISVILQ